MTLEQQPDYVAATAGLPDLLKAHLSEQIDKLNNEFNWPQNSKLLGSLPVVLSCSDFILRTIQRQPQAFQQLLDEEVLLQPYSTGFHLQTLQTRIAADADEGEIKRELRRYRNLAMLCIAWRDRPVGPRWQRPLSH